MLSVPLCPHLSVSVTAWAPQEDAVAEAFFSVIFAEFAQFRLGVMNMSVNYVEKFVPLPARIARVAPKMAKAALAESSSVD